MRKAFTREDDLEWQTKYIKGNKNQVSHYTMGESKMNRMGSETKFKCELLVFNIHVDINVQM